MKDLGLIIGTLDPVHYGHIDLIKTGLLEFEKLDFRVGDKSICSLSCDLRKEALNLALDEEGLEDRVNILKPKETLLSLDYSKYNGMVMGSNLLNVFKKNNKKYTDFDRFIFSQLNYFVVLGRKGVNVDLDLLNRISFEKKFVFYLSKFDFSSSKIRLKNKSRLNFEEDMPKSSYDFLKDYFINK